MSARLFHGDCLDLMPNIPDQSVDMVLCDLPYGTTQNKWDSIIPFDRLWPQLWRALKQSGVVALTASQPFTSALVMSCPDMFRHEWIWRKNRGSNFANTVREPMKEHESVLIFSRGKWTYNKIMEERRGGGKGMGGKTQRRSVRDSDNYNIKSAAENTLTEMRVPSSVQEFICEVGHHPTQKPVTLMEYMIRTYTNEGDVVLDNCMGSGTTGVACNRTGRNFIGIEKDTEYFRVASERIGASL